MGKNMIGRIIKGPVIGTCSNCDRDIRARYDHYEQSGEKLYCSGNRLGMCRLLMKMRRDRESFELMLSPEMRSDAKIRRYLSTRLPDTSNITLLREYDDIWRVEYDHNGTTHVLAVSKSVLEHREAVA